MDANSTLKALRATVLAVGLIAGGSALAWHGGGGHGGGGWHGGGGGWHGGGGGWHGGGGGWHGGGWGGGGWGVGGVVIGAPLIGGYYAPACQSYQVCNQYGRCWLRQSCY